MPSPAEPARRGNRFMTLYAAIWGIAACVALAYLVTTFAGRSGILSQMAGGLSPVVTGSIDASKAMPADASELESVKQSLTAVQTDVQGIKDVLGRQDARDREVKALRSDVTDLSNTFALREERERQLSSRLAAVEARQSVTENVATAPRATLQSQAGRDAGDVNTTVTGSVEDPARRMAAPAVRAETKATAKPQPAQAKPETTQTASAAAATPAFGAPKVVNAQPKPETISGPVGLQLTSADSPEALRLSWLKLSSGHGDILQNLDVRYRPIPTAKGNVYRLIAGPVADTAEGARMCAELKARKLGCAVASFSGEPL
ncbi:MAG: hypothetical protein ABWZ74_10255 [Hyphomicrobiaceae bacterium]